MTEYYINCDIIWNNHSLDQWKTLFSSITQSNLLQSYDYAVSMASILNQRPLWGEIRINEEPAGLVQIMEARLFGRLIHALTIDRGPLWFDGYNTMTNLKAFISRINQEFPARFGRSRRFIPEHPQNSDLDTFMETQNFKKTSSDPYQTVWLNLNQNIEDLEKGFRKTWRQSLKKSQKKHLQIRWDSKGDLIDWMIQSYAHDKALKKYPGPDPKILYSLAKQFSKSGHLIIGQCIEDNNDIAGIMMIEHGRSATYQAGFTTQQGRDSCAHHFLFWNSLDFLKQRGILDFDLGGINDQKAASLKVFKQGMGGQTIHLCGLYT